VLASVTTTFVAQQSIVNGAIVTAGIGKGIVSAHGR